MPFPKAFIHFLKFSFMKILTVILTILFVLTFPILIVILSPIIIFRFCVSKLAKCLQPQLGKMLCSRSSLMALGSLYEDPKNTIVLPLLAEGVPDIHRVRNSVEKNLLSVTSSKSEPLFPEMKQNLVYWMGFLFWKSLTKPFKIEDHVYYHVEKPGNPVVNFDQFLKFVNELTEKSWSKNKALWEMIIVPNVTPWSSPSKKEHSVIVLRFHHSLGDGLSIIKLLSRIDQSGSIDKVVQPYLAKNGEKRKGPSVFQSLGIILKAPYDLAKSCLEFPDKNLWQLKGELKGHCCGTISESISMKELKYTKNRLRVGFTALVTALIAGGIREMMKKRGDKLPEKISLRFPIPLFGHSEKLRNYATFGSILMDLTEEDSLQRLKTVQKGFEGLRRSTLPLVMSHLCVLGGSLFPGMINSLSKTALKNQSVVFSNFPGPNSPSDLFGHLIKQFYFSSSVADTGALAFSAVTYTGHLTLSVGADSAILPSNKYAQDLLSFIIKEFEILKSSSNIEIV